ncbi:MAG: carboxypeptidase-like regulatory domain-containing protein, partial [Bacteroidota bacterium]
MKRKVFIALLFFTPSLLMAQEVSDFVKGRIVEEDEQGHEVPLEGANVYWLGTTTGSASDQKGFFSLNRTDESNMLVVSFVGYVNDTIEVVGDRHIHVKLKSSIQLD